MNKALLKTLIGTHTNIITRKKIRSNKVPRTQLCHVRSQTKHNENMCNLEQEIIYQTL